MPAEDQHAKWMGALKVFQQEDARDFLRCVKYWHSQRQIPGSKEGGYPALAWLFLALQVLTVHTCESKSHSQRVLNLLQRFFGLLDGDRSGTFWPFPHVKDPVDGHSLTQELPFATQLLYAAECRRASRAVTGDVAQLFEPRGSAALAARPGQHTLAVVTARKLWLAEACQCLEGLLYLYQLCYVKSCVVTCGE